MSRQKTEHVLRDTFAEGKFGDGEMVEIVYDDTKGEDQFASSVVFATVRLKKQCDLVDRPVLLKFQHDDEFVRNMMNCDAQFYNEALVYGSILPYLERGNIVRELFPEFIHGHATYGDKPSEEFIIIQDLRGLGFRLTTERLFIDYDHCVLTLKQLGRFHALSYFAKQNHSDEFMEKVKQLKETHFIDRKREECNAHWIPCMKRCVPIVLEQSNRKEFLKRFLEDPFTVLKELVVPEEPVAVLCHGDFCRNNVLYKYDRDGKPIEVKFFDLATARYTSPVFDLAFFIFLNISSETRRDRWNELLAVYHEGLATAFPGTEVPSLEVIKKEMESKAVYVIVFLSFFIPMMMSEDNLPIEEYKELTEEEVAEMATNLGGQAATDAIVAVLEDLILKKCL